MVALGLLCTGLLSLAYTATAGQVVDLGYAKYRGNVTLPNSVAFLGVPYAEPPLGERRWRAPLPLNTARVSRQTRGRIVDASKKPDFCIQGSTGSGDAGGAGSEDCLHVNVYAPLSAKKGDKLPVLVYIHGGGYVYGNPTNWPFDHWINQVPEVVIVSVYYRLDAFGFLTHPELSNSALGDLNVGFLDQTQALRWVQAHIDAFGGDPKRVTINGESAGGSSVELHLVSPPDKGLFTQAIAQSVYRTPVTSPQQQVPQFNFFAEKAGCAADSVAATMSCLRKASISAIARAQDAPTNGLARGWFRPVIDGKAIPAHPTTSILQGNFFRVPLIVGATSNETLSGGDDFHASLKSFFPPLTDQDLADWDAHYPLSDFDSVSAQARVATGESELRCAVEIMGGAFAQKSKAYTYRYNSRNPTGSSLLVEHAAENWMMFKGTNTGFNGTTTFSPMTPAEDAFAEELIAYWLSFVRSGDPNTHKLARAPQWPLYDARSAQRIVLTEGTETATGTTVETIPSLERSRCEFVAGKATVQQA